MSYAPSRCRRDLSSQRSGSASIAWRGSLNPLFVLRSEEHTSELQSPCNLVCRLLLEKKKTAELHMLPVLMTCVTSGVRLLPAALSTGVRSHLRKSLATALVGGLVLGPIALVITIPLH